MKTTIASMLLMSSVAIADIAPIGPDFVGTAPRAHVDRSLVASGEMSRIEPLDVVAFAHDSTFLAGDSVAQVDRAAKWLLRHPRQRVVLEGHTDKLGVFPYNEDLATRRMQVVRDRLTAWGISSDRILLISYGEAEAIAPENAADRRVVMFATDKPVQRILTAQLESRRALVATWTERGSLLQLQNGLNRPAATSKAAVSRR